MPRNAAILAALLLLLSPLGAQTQAPSLSQLRLNTLALDIAVSTYYELVQMAADNGVETAGSAQALRDRLYSHFGLKAPAAPKPEGAMKIEQAASVSYLDPKVSQGDFIQLSGPLALSIDTDDGFTHRITADQLIYDRLGNRAIASGHVTYERQGNERADTFSGETIIVDLDSYSGVFVDGAYDFAPSGTVARTLLFRFERLSRRGDSLTELEGARVSSCDVEPPHYQIRAGKAWLYENGDWALSGATLYVGVVPVLWLPFFYYPADEIAFHPVVGFGARSGAYLQTTTYLIGERDPGRSDSSALSVLSSSASGAKEPSGLFLRRTASAAAGQDRSSDMLRAALDAYSSLGVFAGVDGLFGLGNLSSLTFSAGLGVSRSVFLQANGYYSPLDASAGYSSVWNRSAFLGAELPFRFGLSLSYKAQGSSGGLRYSTAIEIPLYSDPFFEQDFSARNESAALYSIFDANNEMPPKRGALNQSIVSSLSWAAPASRAAPLLAKVSVSKLASYMTWKSKQQSTSGLDSDGLRLLSVDPSREFYYPDSLKPVDASVALSGRLFALDSRQNEGPLPAQAEGTAAQPRPSYNEASLDWTFNGSFALEDKFRSSQWVLPSDVDGELSYVVATGKASVGLDAQAGLASGLLTAKIKASVSVQDQRRPVLVDERSSPTSVHPYLLSDYTYRNSRADMNAVLALSPLMQTKEFASTNINYSISGALFRTQYAGLDGPGAAAQPTYDTSWFKWDADSVTLHALGITFGYAAAAAQRLSFQAALPPLSEKYSATYTLDSTYAKLSLQGALSRESGGAALAPSLLSARLTAGRAPFPVAAAELSWDFGAGAPLSSVNSIEYGWAKAAFVAKKAKGYYFDSGAWTSDGTESFRPYEFSVSLQPKFEGGAASPPGVESPMEDLAASAVSGAAGVSYSIKPSLSYTQNLVRFTESAIKASLSVGVTSPAGTSITLSSSSINKSAWRYWPGLFPASGSLNPTDYRRGILSDIIESLSVWDSAKLRNTLFKLQSMNLKLAQDLHDWNLAATLGMNPVKVTPDSGRSYYQLDFSFSLAVTWKDIPELKTAVTYSEGEFQ